MPRRSSGVRPRRGETTTETYVRSLVIGAMERTHENNPEASAADYIADLVRCLNNHLPGPVRFFTGDNGAG